MTIEDALKKAFDEVFEYEDGRDDKRAKTRLWQHSLFRYRSSNGVFGFSRAVLNRALEVMAAKLRERGSKPKRTPEEVFAGVVESIRKQNERKQSEQAIAESFVCRLERVAAVGALVAAKNATIEGMKAENANRLSNGCSIAYGDADFAAMSAELESLVRHNFERGES